MNEPLEPKDRKPLKAYLTYFIAATVLAAACAWLWDLFQQTELLEVVKILSDCFFLPGVMLLGFSLLGWLSSKGAFDIFGYAMNGFFSLWKKESYYHRESYYDYCARKEEKRKPFNLPMMVVGLTFFVLGAIGTVVFLCLE